MHDDFVLLFPKRPQVSTMHAWLCSDLACVYNNQSSCIVLHCVVLLHDKLFRLCKHDNFPKLPIKHFVDSRVTKLVIANMPCMACVL